MSAAQVACHIASRAMVQELRVARALGMPWREAMDSSHRVLDDILEVAGTLPQGWDGDAPDGWWMGS